jgi:lysophospholipase L1-like esterase
MSGTQEVKPDQYVRPAARLVGGVIALLFGIVLGAVGLEIVTRTVLDDGMDFDLEMWKYARDLKKKSEFAEIGHEHVPGSSGFYMGVPVVINAMGQRDRDFSLAKPAQSYRIVMLGDSLTFGWGVAIEHTPSKLLETRLNANPAGKKFEVINAGVGNYNSAMEVYSFLRKWSGLKPDMVILNYFINDAEPTPRRRNSTIFEHSEAAVYIAARIDKLKREFIGGSNWRDYYTGLYADDAGAWAMNKKAIGKLIAYCKENNIRFMLVNYPELHELNPYPFEEVTAAVKSIADAEGVPFVDLLPSVRDFVPEILWVSPTDAHPDKRANEVFVAALEQAMKANYPEIFLDRTAY